MRGRMTHEEDRWRETSALTVGGVPVIISHMRSARRKSSVSRARTYAGMGDFWDEQDLSDYWVGTWSVRVDARLKSDDSSAALRRLLMTVRRAVRERCVCSHTLIDSALQHRTRRLTRRSKTDDRTGFILGEKRLYAAG